jgi:hypothetical protein
MGRRGRVGSVIRFSVLGGLDLQDSRNRQIATLIGQPKRIALLACLALSGPTGFQQRDWLLGMLWPELDVQRGRATLRNARRAGAVKQEGPQRKGCGPGEPVCGSGVGRAPSPAPGAAG